MKNNTLLRKFIPVFLRHLAALVVVIGFTLLLAVMQPYLEYQIIALLYLLPVVAVTLLLGLTPGILAALAAFLSFNFTFILPLYTMQVKQSQDLITLIIFLIVSIMVSQLLGQARNGMRLARSREREARWTYELISDLASLQDKASIVDALASHTITAFGFSALEIFINASEESPSISTVVPAGTVRTSLPQLVIPLITSRGREGEMRIWQTGSALTGDETRLLEVFAGQAALSLERVRLAKGEHKARLLAESDSLKTSLLNSVSHELRSPLAAIKASVSSLRSGSITWDSSAHQDLLATIEEESDHLNLLVGNLLDMSRIESGALKPQRRWNAIEEIANGAIAKMRSQLKDHHLVTDFPASLPLVPTDYVMIGQVITNLVSNSVKYSALGSTITISARQETDCLQIELSNESPPVPPDQLERIFDKFNRITRADSVTGTGLGLSICKGLVEAHGGHIWAENPPPAFRFLITLPLTLDGTWPSLPQEAEDG